MFNIEELINNFYISRLIYIILIVMIGLAIVKSFKKDKIVFRKRLNLKNINYRFMFKMLFLSFFIRIVIEQFLIITKMNTTITISPNNLLEVIMEFIATCLFAPIFEEIIFRFGLYEKLNKKLNFVLSMLITSIIFALIHLYKIDGIIILFAISIIWNYSYYKTKNLFYPIILHLFHNIYALICNINIGNIYYIVFGIICLFGYLFLSLKRQKN